MSVEQLLPVAGIAVTAVGLIVTGFWAVARAAGNLYEKRLDERFGALTTLVKELERVGGERLQKLEAKYELLDGDVRRILIELPRDYVSRADYVRRETVMEAKIDQLSLRLENWFLRGEK